MVSNLFIGLRNIVDVIGSEKICEELLRGALLLWETMDLHVDLVE